MMAAFRDNFLIGPTGGTGYKGEFLHASKVSARNTWKKGLLPETR